MIAIKDFLGSLQIEVIITHLIPREIQHKLQIIPLNAKFGYLRVHSLKLGHFFFKKLLHFFWPILFPTLGTHFLDLRFGAGTAKFLLDLSQLLLQEILPLLLIEIRTNFVLNFVFHFQHLRL